MAETIGTAVESRCPRWTVAGNSLGGWISAWIALQRPALVERLVLIDAAGLSEISSFFALGFSPGFAGAAGAAGTAGAISATCCCG